MIFESLALALALPYLPPDRLILFRLITVLAVYAALVFAGRRGWLKPAELPWVGGAVIFWAIAWLFGPVLLVVRSKYLDAAKSAAISAGLVAPVIIAMIVGLWFVIRRVKNPPAPLSAKSKTKKRSS